MKRLILMITICAIALAPSFAQLHRASGWDVDSLNVRSTTRIAGTVSIDNIDLDTLTVGGITIDSAGYISLQTPNVWLIDPSGADTGYIYDDGTNLIISGDNPLKVYGAITVEKDSTVTISKIVVTSEASGAADVIPDSLVDYGTEDSTYIDGVGFTLAGEDETISGSWSFTGGMNQTYAPATGAANVGNIFKTTLAAGETFSGTTGYQFKVYDEDATVDHTGEHCAVYANMKLLSTPTAGGVSVLYSGHNYASAVQIDAGMWLYGKLYYGLKISGDTIAYGIDLSETAVDSAAIKLENGGLITNPDSDSIYIDEAYLTCTGSMVATAFIGDLTGTADDVDTSGAALAAALGDRQPLATALTQFAAIFDSVTIGAADSIVYGWKYGRNKQIVDFGD